MAAARQRREPPACLRRPEMPSSPCGARFCPRSRPEMPEGEQTSLLRGDHRVPAGTPAPPACALQRGRWAEPARPSGEGSAGFVSPRRCDCGASPACSVFPDPHSGARRRIRIRVPAAAVPVFIAPVASGAGLTRCWLRGRWSDPRGRAPALQAAPRGAGPGASSWLQRQ